MVAILPLPLAIPAVCQGQASEVIWISGAARLSLSRMFSVEVRVFGCRIEGRGEDVGAASAQARCLVYIAEGTPDCLELLLADLDDTSIECHCCGRARDNANLVVEILQPPLWHEIALQFPVGVSKS